MQRRQDVRRLLRQVSHLNNVPERRPSRLPRRHVRRQLVPVHLAAHPGLQQDRLRGLVPSMRRWLLPLQLLLSANFPLRPRFRSLFRLLMRALLQPLQRPDLLPPSFPVYLPT